MITALRPLAVEDQRVVQFAPGQALPIVAERQDAARVRCAVADLPALVAAATGARIYLEVVATELTSRLDVAELAGAGVVTLTLQGDQNLDACRALAVVAALRDAMECGVAPVWHSTLIAPRLADDALVHLPPPVDACEQWAQRHDYAQFYWRKGPQFVSVVDKRAETQARYVLDEAELLALFETIAQPVRIEALPSAWRAGLHDLLDAGIALELGGWITRLPYRLRRWPMPSEGL